MKKDDVKYIESVLQKTESETLEFKGNFNKDQIGKIICGFLNASGGQLVLGINENKEIMGIVNAEIIAKRINAFLINSIVPEPAFSLDIQLYKKKSIIFINVWQGTNQPYIYNGAVFFRIGASTQKATSEQLGKLIHGNSHRNERWEAKSAIELEVDDIDLNEVKDCIKDANTSKHSDYHI